MVTAFLIKTLKGKHNGGNIKYLKEKSYMEQLLFKYFVKLFVTLRLLGING